MTQVYVDGRRTSIVNGRSMVMRRALLSGKDGNEAVALYQKGFIDSIDGEHARDELLNDGVEIVLG